MAARNIEVKNESVTQERENFFEAIEKDFVAEKGSLVEIADRKTKEWKLSFFDKVKDFFENPYAGIKYLSSRLFGEKISEFMYELDEAKKNVTAAKENVMEVSKTAVDQVKGVIDGIPDDLKKIPLAGSMLASAVKVKDYLVKNAIKAAEMPEDEKAKLVWWKDILRSAGVDEGELVHKNLLELLAKRKNWTDIRDNLVETVSGEKYEKKIDKKIESGEMYKEWPFTGEKLGVTAGKFTKKVKTYSKETIAILRDNPAMSSTVAAYMAYKMGPTKGLNAVGMTGKLMLTTGLAPLKYAKNNPKKVILLLVGGRLMQQNTRWDEIGEKVLYNTPLPKDYEEFNKVISTNPMYKELVQGMTISKGEFEQAMGVMKSEEKLEKSLDEILESITLTNVAKSTLDVVGQTPKQKVKYENFKGIKLLESEVLSKEHSEYLEKMMGEDGAKEFSKVTYELLSESRQDELGEVSKEKIEAFNKFKEISRYEIVISDNYLNLVYKPINPEESIVTRKIGLNSELSQADKELLAPGLKMYSDMNTIDFLATLGEGYSLGDAYMQKMRELLGRAGEFLTGSPEELSGAINEKMKSGEAVLVSDGENFFLSIGTEYILLPYTVWGEVYRAAVDEDYDVMDVAKVYAGGLAVMTVIGSGKALGKVVIDNAYKHVVGYERVAQKGLIDKGKSLASKVTYPITKPVSTAMSAREMFQNLRADGFKKLVQRSSYGELVSSMRNINDSSRLKLAQHKSKLLSSKAKESMDLILKSRREVIALRDGKIFSSNVLNRYPDGVTDPKVIKGLIEKIEVGGLSDEMVKIMGVENYASLKSLKEIDRDQLRAILGSFEIALDVEKRILAALQPVSSMKNLKIVESIREASTYMKGTKVGQKLGDIRRAQRAAEANRIAKLSKGAKMAKMGAAGALAFGGAVALNEAYQKDKDIERKENASEVPGEILDGVVDVENKILELMSKKNLNKILDEDHGVRAETLRSMKGEYLSAHNEFMNFIFKNKSKFEGNLDLVVEALQKKYPKAQYKVEVEKGWLGGSRKVLNIAAGTIQIVENPDGSIELGRQTADVFENNMTFMARFQKEGYTGLGMGLVPFVGTYKDLSEGYDAYKVGNDELMAEKVSFGVSSLATDFLLGAKTAGGAAKLLTKAGDFKKLEKLGSILSSASDLSKVSKVTSKAAKAGSGVAVAGLGYGIFAGDINKFTKISYE